MHTYYNELLGKYEWFGFLHEDKPDVYLYWTHTPESNVLRFSINEKTGEIEFHWFYSCKKWAQNGQQHFKMTLDPEMNWIPLMIWLAENANHSK